MVVCECSQSLANVRGYNPKIEMKTLPPLHKSKNPSLRIREKPPKKKKKKKMPWRHRDICPLAPRGPWQNQCALLVVLLTLSQFLLGGGGAWV